MSLWAEHAQRVTGIVRCRLHGRTQADCENVAGDVGLALVEELSQRGTPNNPRAWLRRVAQNIANDALRAILDRASDVSLDRTWTKESDRTPSLRAGEIQDVSPDRIQSFRIEDLRSFYREGGSYYPKRAEGTRNDYLLRKWDDSLTFAELKDGAQSHGEKLAGFGDLRLWSEGWTIHEIAKRRGVWSGTVKTTLHRVKEKLRSEGLENNPSSTSTKSSESKDYGYNADRLAVATPRSISHNKEREMTESSKRVLLASEVAKILRVGRRRVYELLMEGKLHGVRVGNRWLVPAAEIDRFLSDGMGEIAA